MPTLCCTRKHFVGEFPIAPQQHLAHEKCAHETRKFIRAPQKLSTKLYVYDESFPLLQGFGSPGDRVSVVAEQNGLQEPLVARIDLFVGRLLVETDRLPERWACIASRGLMQYWL